MNAFKSVMPVSFLSLNTKKTQAGEMFTHAPKVHTFTAWVQPVGPVIRRWCAGGICRFRGNSSNRNHSATGSLSMRTWVFLQTRISVPFFFYFVSDRSVATHAQHVLPFLTTSRCRKTRSAGADYCRLNLQEWFTGTFRVLVPPGNNSNPLWLQRRSTCSRSEPSERKIKR